MIVLQKMEWVSNPDGFFLDRPRGRIVRGIAVNGRWPGEIQSYDSTPTEYKLSRCDQDELKRIYDDVAAGGDKKTQREAEFGDTLEAK